MLLKRFDNFLLIEQLTVCYKKNDVHSTKYVAEIGFVQWNGHLKKERDQFSDPDDMNVFWEPGCCCLCLRGQDGIYNVNHPIAALDIARNNFCTTINSNCAVGDVDQKGLSLSLECIY